MTIKITYENEKTPYTGPFTVHCETELAANETMNWIGERGFEIKKVEDVEIEEVDT